MPLSDDLELPVPQATVGHRRLEAGAQRHPISPQLLDRFDLKYDRWQDISIILGHHVGGVATH